MRSERPLLVGWLVLVAAIATADPEPAIATPGPDGNRYVAGSLDLTSMAPRVIDLPGVPRRVTGIGDSADRTWIVDLDDGRRIRITGAGAIGLVTMADEVVPGPSRLLDPLPDGRVLNDHRKRILVLTHPTDRYAHGILGDRLEPSGIAIVGPAGDPEITWRLTDRSVFETLAPIWVDIDGDNIREIVITRSDGQDGAAIQIFSEDGRLMAAARPIGMAHRWTHLLAVAPLGPDGALEIVAVRTPHIGGVLEYYRLRKDRLELVHTRRGFSTHRIGSRNLDMFVAADFDGDARPDVLLPSQDFKTLHVISRKGSGSIVASSHSLPGTLTTNIAANAKNGGLTVAVGTSGNRLLIWD